MGGLLLDTHAAIWTVDGTVNADVAAHITAASAAGRVYISVVSAWEIGLLANPTGSRPPLQLKPDPISWFQALLSLPGVRLASCTPEIAIAASSLPGELHRDPADRLLVATARALNIPLVTRDREILTYARAGYVQVIPC